MPTQMRGIWAELRDRRVLVSYMRFYGESCRSLAGKCQPRVSSSLIGHLRSGYRKTCTPEVARAIEDALMAPPGTIFEPKAKAASAA